MSRPAPLALRAALALALGLGGSLASAASLRVTVTDRQGEPAAHVAVVVVPAQPGPVAAQRPTTTVITQEKMQFVPLVTMVHPGTTVRFTNRDSFDHHVRGIGPGHNFELRVNARLAPGEAAPEVTLTQPGPVRLSCHLHSTMRGGLYVSPSPWFGVTDENGQAVIAAVPAGPYRLMLWHPEQFLDQPEVQGELPAGAAAHTQAAQLNFAPRKRRAR
jgi:plastocyanin